MMRSSNRFIELKEGYIAKIFKLEEEIKFHKERINIYKRKILDMLDL
jgi:hypothetical protein